MRAVMALLGRHSEVSGTLCLGWARAPRRCRGEIKVCAAFCTAAPRAHGSGGAGGARQILTHARTFRRRAGSANRGVRCPRRQCAPPPAYPRLHMHPMHAWDVWRPVEPPASACTHMFTLARARPMFRCECSAAGETGFGLRGGFPGNVRHSEVFAWTPPRVGARDSVRSHAHGLLRVRARVARHAHALHHPPRAHPSAPTKPARTRTTHAHDAHGPPAPPRPHSGADWGPSAFLSHLCVLNSRNLRICMIFQPVFARARTHTHPTNMPTPFRYTPGAWGASIALPLVDMGVLRRIF